MAESRLKEYIDINPTVKLQKGEVYSSVEMEKITVGKKIADANSKAEYTGKSCSKFLPNDTLMARITPCLENGKIAKYDSDAAGFGSTEFFVLRAKKKKTTADYVYYLSQTHYVRQLAVNSMTGASGRQRADAKFIGNIKWDFPEVGIQSKVADILSAYDNLIENNNRRIKLLEQMAENLYKEWFVRFRFQGYENTKFVDDIPSDWQILRMSDLCYVTDGTHDTPKPVNDGGVPLVTGKCIKNGFIDFNEPYNISYQDHESISKRSGLQTGDILFSNIGTVGTTCLVNYDREFSVKNVIIFKPDNIKVSNYLYSWLNSDSIQAIFATQTNGASQQFVGLNFMRRFKILVPNANVLDLYSDRIKPIRTEIVKLHDINENLIKQRDMLLPRLMSGKLEV